VLVLLLLNAQSIIGKIDELGCVVAELTPDLILITESWCSENVTNAYLKITGYKLQPELRKDRADTLNGIGGGLLVYVRNRLTVLPIDKNIPVNQYCTFKFDDGMGGLNISLIYRSPNSAPGTMDMWTEFIQKTEKNSVILGDFNLPGIDWPEGTASGEREKGSSSRHPRRPGWSNL
jgi:hypothetical protein